MKSPILFIIFNRPETTQRVFEMIRREKPQRLYIAADGPRDDYPQDVRLCRETRKIVEQIDWPCEVKTRFQEKNLGCKFAVSGAIDWFFDDIEEGIILEDDCLPSLSFFSFCNKMLEKYRYSEKIMMVSGSNPAILLPDLKSDYYYSRFYSIWGWATWRRAWKNYDREMTSWPKDNKKNLLTDVYPNKRTKKYFEEAFDNAYQDKTNTWDYQWVYACIKQNGLTIMPKYNLVSNIGQFGTHTGGQRSDRLLLETFELKIDNLLSPAKIEEDRLSDEILFLKTGLGKFNLRQSTIKILIRSNLFNLFNKIRKSLILLIFVLNLI